MIDLSPMRSVQVDQAARTARVGAGATLGDVDRDHPGLRPGHAARHQLDDRHRGPHARRRVRLAEPPARPHHRQPALGRCGHGRGRARPRQRTREPRPVLGHPRRRRQLRRRHVVRVPAPSGRAGGAVRAGRPSRSARRATCSASTATSSRRRPRSSRAGSCCGRRRRCRSSPPSGTARRSSRWPCASRASSPRESGSRRRSARSASRSPTWSGRNPYADWQTVLDPLLTPGIRNYWKSHDFRELSDGLIDVLLEYTGKIPDPNTEIAFAQLGGAISRVPQDATAYGHREAQFVMNVHGRWADPDKGPGLHRVGARPVPGGRAVRDGRRVRELPHPGGGGSRAGGVRDQLRSAGPAQEPVRSGQPVPDEPEHPAERYG